MGNSVQQAKDDLTPSLHSLRAMRHALCRKFVSEIHTSNISKAGFTLLEIVIAIAILAVVLTSLYSAFSSTLDTTEAVENERDFEQAARLALMRIADDLASVYYQAVEGDAEDLPYSFEGSDTEALDEGGKILELTTCGSLDFNLVFPSLRLNRVSYVLETQPDNEGYYNLVRREIPFAGVAEKGEEMVIEVAEDVEQITLTYFDEDGQELPQWDSEAVESEGLLPRLVLIRLQLAGERSRFFTTSVALPPLSTEEQEN